MSSDIKAGDLVRVVWGNCEHTRQEIGEVKTVIGVKIVTSKCGHCDSATHPIAHAMFHHNRYEWGKPLSWLLRIDPPSQPEHTQRDTEVTA